MPTATRLAVEPHTIHLVPHRDGWMLVCDFAKGTGPVFPDLGSALDAATVSGEQVHVVVHERTAA